ncbi:MAG: hypothetical protein ACM3SR_09350, partial [Ignavibacteriales bacterium]
VFIGKLHYKNVQDFEAKSKFSVTVATIEASGCHWLWLLRLKVSRSSYSSLLSQLLKQGDLENLNFVNREPHAKGVQLLPIRRNCDSVPPHS